MFFLETSPPVAPRRPAAHSAHGDARPDDWQWLTDRDDPAVTEYLEAENRYADAVLAPTAELQEQLLDQIRTRVAETDVSAPIWHHGWWYWSRTTAGQQYPVHCRRADPNRGLTPTRVLAAARAALPGAGVAGDGTAPPPLAGEPDDVKPNQGEVVLDENDLAGDSPYFALGVFDIRPDQEVLAYAVDHDGSERYKLRFRDLGSGHNLPDVVDDVYYGSAWSAGGKCFYYVRPDKAMRPWQVWRHTLGTPSSQDELVHQEDDERFFVSVGLTRTKRYVLIESHSKMTSEIYYIDATRDRGRPSVVLERREGVEYDVDHIRYQDRPESWAVRTNSGPNGEKLDNFAVFELPIGEKEPSVLRSLVPYRPEVKVSAVDAFARHLVLLERAAGLEQLRVVPLDGSADHVIPQPEPTYSLGDEANPEWDSDLVRFAYSSLTSPPSSIEYDMTSRRRSVVKQATVGGGFDPAQYRSERLWARAPDGTEVPISLVCRRDQALDGTAPCLLYGYGSYEYPVDPAFSFTRLNFLQRGLVFAIAHIRGGGEMGRPWYEAGRLQNKRNTFSDFIACAEKLIQDGWTSPGHLAIRGGSAGGLLMGAVVNMRPDLWNAVVAEVPFVDIVTTMSDESLPLTVTEWEEWGNPRDDPDAYEYMKSYSPFDNVHETYYPAMYVTAGLNDPRVGYWEPAKWVAKLRATKADNNPLLLKTEMGAGHQGPSGRYDVWRDEARVQAFVLTSLGASAASNGKGPASGQRA
jgi:oligopeptidase B